MTSPCCPDSLARRHLRTGLSAVLVAAWVVSPLSADDWPYHPPARPAVPQLRDRGWGRNALDAFVLARLEKAGLRPNPEADKLTLLRRVTFDLTGLSPTPAEREAFLADQAPDAYERLVDRLLRSPRFGERWAQHWLDVVRYAETEGYKLDRLRPEAYRYRDYVIRAFNDDLPYDRFVRQQLAGDELEPDNPDALVATGFFRLPPEEANASNYRQMRQDLLDDVTDVFGVAFLGVTVGCARCHDHKFDPISQKDYFRLQAFFTPLVQRDDLPLVSAAERERHARQTAAWAEATQSLRTQIDAMVARHRQDMFNETLAVFDPDTQAAVKTPAGKRNSLQRQLAALAMKQLERRCSRAYRRLSQQERARYDELQKQLASFDALKPAPLPLAMAVSDVGPDAPATHRLGTGNYLRPKEEVRPDFPDVFRAEHPDVHPPAGRPQSTGRRSALARWLTRPDHPLTARVIANRVWKHYLDEGIVDTPNDFGVQGGKPTHPELLDYLATELVGQGWRLKALHRLIVTSATYRQASSPWLNPAARQAEKADPQNELLWHAPVKRREAESIRDVALQVAGQLNPRMYGPSEHPELPKPLLDSTYSWDPDERPEERDRRSIYVLAKRNLAYPLLAAFDMPDRLNSCPDRPETITAPQALVRLNGEFALTQARHLGGRLLAAHADDPRALVRRAYVGLFGREPSAEEVVSADSFLTRQARLIAAGGAPNPGSLPTPLPPGFDPARAAAVVDFCHALLNSAEFLYVE